MQRSLLSPVPASHSSGVVPSRALPEPFRTWGGQHTSYPRNSTVHQLFEEMVQQNPKAIAIVDGDSYVAYQDLNIRANRLAHRLLAIGVQPEEMVACCFDRSLDLIVALLAVLKAGAVYVPIDPAYPRTRIDLILQDTGNPLVLTRDAFAHALPSGCRVHLLYDLLDSTPAASEEENPTSSAGPANLAYVMYTSGSTGRPKGVMIEHRGIVRLVRGTDYCRFDSDQVFLQFAPASFDASTFEIWGPLLNGARLVLMPPHSSSLEDLAQAIRRHGVTTLWLTAGLFHLMVEEQPAALHSLRQLLAGGDVLSSHHVRLFLEDAGPTTLINGYGPTENTTFTCCHVMRPGDNVPGSVPIGKPISNTRVYVLDENLDPVPPGQPGELYAAGDGVARGYLNDPETTAAKFVPDPFTEIPKQRMYRTGDLARWRPDGTIEFLGRIDNQVKILGFRIEPAEIEVTLQRHPQVKQVCVVARTENGANRLAAYFVSSDSNLTPGQLRDFAASHLPQHLIPAFFVALSSLPLSEHGKVDRAALSSLALAPDRTASPAPGSELEQALAQLWKRILKVPSVGLDDNFFDLGGDSLLLVAVHSNLQKLLGREIVLTDLFEFATIRKLAEHLGGAPTRPQPGSDIQDRARRQREAFSRARGRRSGGAS